MLADRDTARDGLALRRMIDTRAPSVMQATPATWRMLLEVGWRGTPGLKKIISTGEALPRELADRLLPCADELWNLYGPTETTVYSALCRVTAGDGPILVGKPVDNTQIHIVDKHMQHTPTGVPGELLIGGDGSRSATAGGRTLRREVHRRSVHRRPVAACSHRRTCAVASRRHHRGDRAYRHQVKLRGFRIECARSRPCSPSTPA